MPVRNTLIAVQAALVCLSAPAMGAGTADADRDGRAEAFQSVIDAANAAADRISSIRPLIDDGDFEIMSAVDRLDFDGDEIARFVADAVRYEPYDGVLRGAQATLSARAGNAIDQSLLLIALLEMAGYDAQLLRAGGPDAALGGLLAEAAMRPRRAAPAIADVAGLEAALVEALGARAGDIPAGDISRSLARTGPAGLDGSVSEAAARLGLLVNGEGDEVSAGDYYWVRYRPGSGMAWTMAHPALAGAAPEGLEPDEVLTGSASEDMLHFIEIALEAEILENGRLRREPLMSPWRQPVATLFDQPISVGLFGDIDESSESQAGTLFMPSLNDETPPGAKAVSLRGSVLDSGIMDLDGYAMSGVFSALGDTLQDAGDLVGGRDGDRPSRALTGIVLEVRWTRPSGETREEERWLIDRLANRYAQGEAPRLNLDLSLRWLAHRMNFRRDIIVSSGGGHDAHRLAAALEAEALGLRHGADLLGITDRGTGEMRMSEAQPLTQTHAPFLLTLQSVIDQDVAIAPGRHVFRDGPVVLSLHRAWDENDGVDIAYIDILMNPWSGVVHQDDALRHWPEGALARGVLDTRVELDFGSEEPGEDYFSALRRTGDLVIARRAADVANLPQDARLAAEADLAEGFVLAMLPASGAGREQWWRIRPDGGEVLGRNALGGQSTTEYITTYGANAWALFSFTKDTKSCVDGYEAEGGLGCCLMYTLVLHSGSQVVGRGASKGMTSVASRAAGGIEHVANLAALDLITSLSVELGLHTAGVAGGAFLPDLTRAGICGPPER
ncbi:MAG: hypothetical protein ACXIVL_07760 [Oceanicaulis sp.]